MASFDDTFSCGELTSADVTPASNSVGRTVFNVVAAERELMHDQFRVASVCVAIHGPDSSNQQLHVAVWDTHRFLYGCLLDPCDVSSVPIDLRTRLESLPFDRVYYFEINVDLLAGSWCSILTPHPVDDRTHCVLRLKEFKLLEDGR